MASEECRLPYRSSSAGAAKSGMQCRYMDSDAVGFVRVVVKWVGDIVMVFPEGFETM